MERGSPPTGFGPMAIGPGVHLLLNTSLLEPPSCLSFSETVPSVEELCRQLDIIEIQALMTKGFAAAIGLW